MPAKFNFLTFGSLTKQICDVNDETLGFEYISTREQVNTTLFNHFHGNAHTPGFNSMDMSQVSNQTTPYLCFK